MKIANELTNEYRLLSKSLQDAELRYKNLALTKGLDAEATKEALEQALSIRNVLDKLDGNLRNYQRNVGNYKSAFDGLGFSFTQIARELPSLGISASQFFLAISNNLPMVVDEIGKAKAEIAALRAQGEETPSLFKRVSSSIFSFNVAISVGIALLSAFGDKLVDAVGSLFGFGNEAEKLREQIQLIQRAQLELIKTTEEFNRLFAEPVSGIDRLNTLLQVYRDLNKSKKDQLELEKQIATEQTLQAQADYERTGGRTKLAELEFQVRDALSKYQGLVEAGSRATDKTVQERLQKQAEQAKTELDLFREQYDTQKKIVKDYNDGLNELQSRENQLAALAAEEKRKIALETARIQSQTVIDANQRILDDVRSSERSQIQSIRNIAEERKRIAKAELDNIESNPANRNQDGSFTAEAINARKKYNAEIVKIDADAIIQREKLENDFRVRREQANFDAFKSRTESENIINQKVFEDESKSYERRIQAFSEYYANISQLIKDEAFLKKQTQFLTGEQLVALDAETKKKLLENELQYRQKAAEIFVNTQKQTLTITQSIDSLKFAQERLRLQKAGASQKEITDKEYEYQKQQLNNTIFINEEILASQKSTDAQKLQSTIDINNAKKQLADLEFNREKQQADQIKSLYISLVSEIRETVFSVIFSAYDKQLQDLERRQQDLQRRTESQINLVNQLGLTEAERIRETARIQKQAAFENEQLEQRRRKLARERAIFEKAESITNIIQSTAVSYMQQIGKNPIFAQLILAIGALQLARVIATPLPQYKHGRGKGKKELAITGDGGVNEYILRGTGEVEKTPDTPTLTHLMADDMVFKDKNALVQYFAKISGLNALPKSIKENRSGDLSGAMLSELQQIRKKDSTRIFIENKAPIETTAWYDKMIKG